ncbi:hypothetical protein BH09PSE5_BH09PSE5_46370 [soil metagenome]
MNTQESFLVSLQSGQRFQASVDARTYIRVKSGVVRVTEPMQWLANTAIAPTVVVAEGQEFEVPRSGWLELEALHGKADVVQFRRPSPIAVGFHAVQLRLARFVSGLTSPAGLSKR